MKKLRSTSDTIIINIKGEEVYLTGTFNDGYASLTDDEGKNYFMTYPKASEITDKMKKAIEKYTCRDLEEYQEVALKYGKLNDKKTEIERKRCIVYDEMIGSIIKGIKKSKKTALVLDGNFTVSMDMFGDERTHEEFTPLKAYSPKAGELCVEGLFEKVIDGEGEALNGNFTYKKGEFDKTGMIFVNYIFDNIENFVR